MREGGVGVTTLILHHEARLERGKTNGRYSESYTNTAFGYLFNHTLAIFLFSKVALYRIFFVSSLFAFGCSESCLVDGVLLSVAWRSVAECSSGVVGRHEGWGKCSCISMGVMLGRAGMLVMCRKRSVV